MFRKSFVSWIIVGALAISGLLPLKSFAEDWVSPFHYGQGVFNRGNGKVGSVVNPNFGGWVVIRPYTGGPDELNYPANLSPLLSPTSFERTGEVRVNGASARVTRNRNAAIAKGIQNSDRQKQQEQSTQAFSAI